MGEDVPCLAVGKVRANYQLISIQRTTVPEHRPGVERN
jgi:hypothetical protein